MLHSHKIGVVIPAAGKGTRMGGSRSKQFLELDGIPIVVHTLRRFQSYEIIDAIIIAAAEEDVDNVKAMAKKHELSKVVEVVKGGKERQDSVWNGLRQLKQYSPDVVLVHDAVRPFISHDCILQVTEAAAKHDAAIVAVCSKDTVKLSGGDGYIQQTPPRQNVWITQTPQAFRYSLLCEAFEQANTYSFSGTDEASLVERLGVKVKIVEGNYDNIKITTPGDLELAHLINKRWVKGGTLSL
jgi:2-C-methyl-D-erythritol 4-phosphate cytidylyltransferase